MEECASTKFWHGRKGERKFQRKIQVNVLLFRRTVSQSDPRLGLGAQ